MCEIGLPDCRDERSQVSARPSPLEKRFLRPPKEYSLPGSRRMGIYYRLDWDQGRCRIDNLDVRSVLGGEYLTTDCQLVLDSCLLSAEYQHRTDLCIGLGSVSDGRHPYIHVAQIMYSQAHCPAS